MSLLESERVRDLLERAGLGGLEPRVLKAALILGAIVVAVGAWRFWPRAPEPEVHLQPSAPVAPLAEESSETTAEVVVHVAGAVFRPGVYRLPLGSRVDDAVRVAGGGVGAAALDALNLARILADGEQVYVPTIDELANGAPPPSGTTQGGGGSASDVVNINTASAQELEALPGVGPSTAQKIADDREANGPFAQPEDLMRVPGIGPKKFEALREFVVCG